MRVENANPEFRYSFLRIPDRSEGGASGMTERWPGGVPQFYALKYAIWVVVASKRPFGDHNSPFWSP
jgi:hypothetical protein